MNLQQIMEEGEREFDKEFYDSNLECVSLHDTSPISVKAFLHSSQLKLLQSILDGMPEEKEYAGGELFPQETNGFNQAIKQIRQPIEEVLNKK